MTVSTPAHRAAERLRQVLPVRTHFHAPKPMARKQRSKSSENGVRPTTQETKARRRKIKALESQGLNGNEIAERLEISPATVSRHRRGLLKALK